MGTRELNGSFVTAFGEPTDGTNPFYNDPSLICASLFSSVQTGDSIASELSAENGALWPVDLTEEERRPIVARRRAMDRLSGTLFAPAIPQDFDWTPEAFRNAIPEDRRGDLPAGFDELVVQTLQKNAGYYFDGDVDAIALAEVEKQQVVWYDVFDVAKIEPPPRQTCVLVTLTELAKENLGFAIGRGVMGAPRGRLLQLAKESGVKPASAPSMAPPPFDRPEVESVAGGPPPLRIGGPPVDNVAIDEEGTITLVRLVGYSILVGVILSYICFGSFKVTMMVFIVGGTAATVSMSCVWWTGGRVDAILMSMPSLVYVLGLAGAIHVVNYYRDEVRARGKTGAAGRALRHALLPCTLASLTTAIGLVSLHSSNLAPISNFGLYSAIGVIATLAILFSFLPAALQVFASESFTNSVSKDTAKAATATVENQEEGWLSDAWAAVGRWITRHHAPVAIASMLILVGASIGLAKIQTSVQLLKLFDPGSRIIRDYAWMEDNFGKLVPMELIVRVPPSMQSERLADQANHDSTSDAKLAVTEVQREQSMPMLKRAEVVSRISSVVRRTLGERGLGEVGHATSADTFLPPLPGSSNGYNPIRAKFNRELLEGRDELLDSDYVRIEQGGPYQDSELWRISLRVAALSDTDYGYFINTLRTTVEPVLRAYDTREVLLKELCTDADGNFNKLNGKHRVLVIGSERPETLAAAKLIDRDRVTERESGQQSAQSDRIDTQMIYLSTLGEILAGESIRRPVWLDPVKMEKPIDIGGERWNKLIAAFDSVIWVGGEGVEEKHFAGAASMIDARRILGKELEPKLLDGKVPTVIGSGNLQVVYTGVIPVVYKAQRTLLSSLVQSIAMAFVLIAIVMILLLNPGRFPFGWLRPTNFANGFAAGSVSMIPNLFPVLLVFGVMGHRGDLVDIGTMMTASVAMGVAVDDTIHFLSWFRAFLDKGYSRVEAVIQTYRRVGPAMTQTTVVGGLGLFVFALSTFTPTQRFGTLMLVLLAAALIGDLILLPALLAGPLGKCFRRRDGAVANEDQRKSDSGNSGESADKQSKETEEQEADSILKVHFPDKTRTDRAHRIKRSS